MNFSSDGPGSSELILKLLHTYSSGSAVFGGLVGDLNSGFIYPQVSRGICT